MKFELLLIAVLLVAGCSQPAHAPQGSTSTAPRVVTNGSSSETSIPPGAIAPCIFEICRADPQSHDAKVALERYGLTQITQGIDTNFPSNVAMGHGWLIWQSQIDQGEGENYKFNDAIFAYNLATTEFIPINADADVKATTPLLHDNDLLFFRTASGSHGELTIWNATTRLTHILHPPLQSYGYAIAFDGTWMVLPGSNGTASGMWAWNSQSNALRFLYKPYPGNQKPDGSYELFTVAREILNGSLVYSLHGSNSASTVFTADFFALDLTSGEQRRYHLPNVGVNRMDTDGTYIAIEDGGKIWLFDLETGENSLVNGAQQSNCGNPRLNGGWLVYACAGAYETSYGKEISNATVIHLATGYRLNVGPWLPGELSINLSIADGKHLVLQALRYSDKLFTTYHADFYSMPLPNR